MSVIRTIGVQFPPLPQVLDCSAKIMPSQDAARCRELLALKAAESFPWDRQHAEAKDFFRQFQNNVSADRREEVAGMMMYPLRITYYTDPWNAHLRSLNSATELLDVYDKVFHKSVKDYITKLRCLRSSEKL
jgi:hypothetical protein